MTTTGTGQGTGSGSSNGSGSWLRRVGAEVETVGVEPVPDDQRRTTPGKLLVVWAMTSASATTPLIGMLLYPYGLWYMVGAIVLTWAIFMIPTGLFSEMGRHLPLTALVVARRNFGWSATFLLSILFTFVNMAWFGLNTATGALVLAALTHTGASPWYWIVGGVDIVLVLFGFKWLEYFYRYTAVLLVACYAALTVYLFLHYHVHVPHQTAPMQWGTAASTVAGFSIVAWMYKVSTISRFARPADGADGSGRRHGQHHRGRQQAAYLLVPAVGIMLPVLLMGVMGAFSQEAIGNWNIAVLGAHISGWGAVAAVGAALGVLHTNAMNLYPSTVDLLVSLNTARRPTKWDQPIATVVLGVLGTALAQAGILSHAQTFITDVGDLLGPFAFVMLVDWLWGLRDRADAATYFARPSRMFGDWRVAPIISFLVGFVLAYWGHDFLPGWFIRQIPITAVASLVAALLYGLWLALTGSPAAGSRGPAAPAEPSNRTDPAIRLNARD
ncbi:MAG TPA: cytosine permease [Acidimicrobiales bacterium]|nr:cytosine permease [Acidimicrobiales bacterium]